MLERTSRPDFSDYVAHFTKNGAPLRAKENPDDEALRAVASGDAYERLVSILTAKKIIATPMPWTNKKAVAFTECPWGSMIDHARRYSPYGVGFTKAHLFAAGGGPAIYLRPDLHEKQEEFKWSKKPDFHGLHPDVYAFVTAFSPFYAPKAFKDLCRQNEWPVEVDYSHEREWRVPHDFTFEHDQVQFVVVNSYEDVARFPKELKDAIGPRALLGHGHLRADRTIVARSSDLVAREKR
jgi:hypothetical protein